MIDPVSLAGIAGAPLVVALVQLVRVSWPELPTRYLPAVTLVLSIALNLALATQTGAPLALACLVGVVTGLTASGLYSHATAALTLRSSSSATSDAAVAPSVAAASPTSAAAVESTGAKGVPGV